MEELKYTLITDGSSDSTLFEIIKWSINDLYPKLAINGKFCDFRCLPHHVELGDVLQRIKIANVIYPFDVCLYHRDAESIDVRDILVARENEIINALPENLKNKVVCVIPVKMMETWLLTNETAIKAAAGNRNYTEELNIPSVGKLEKIQSPKDLLHRLLREASGNTGRRLKHFNVHQAVHLVAENTDDFSPLRKLEAFKKFEENLKNCINSILKEREYHV